MEENKKPLAEGEEKEETVSKNFIEREIDKDLAEGVYDHVLRNRTDIFILDTLNRLF